MELYEKIRASEDFANILSFGVSVIILCTQRRLPRHLKVFSIYLAVAFCIAVLHLFMEHYNIISPSVYSLINNILLLFHYSFLGLYVIFSTREPGNLKYTFPVFTIFLISTFLCLLTKEITVGNKLAFGVANTGLAVLSGMYYYSLSKTSQIINPARNPSFWIITGIFIAMVVNAPLHIARNYSDKIIQFDICATFFALCSFSYIITHVQVFLLYS